jgi:hypothetical protein
METIQRDVEGNGTASGVASAGLQGHSLDDFSSLVDQIIESKRSFNLIY